MKEIIKKITVVSGQGVKSFSVGEDGVVKIIDNSAEFENNICFMYSILGENEKKIASIENAPVVIEYN